MGIECSYGFWDLYRGAFGKEPSAFEVEEFNLVTQDERNKLVALWAEKAGWPTDWRVGTDGQRYLAFYP